MTATQAEVETTDILARKVGEFERCNVKKIQPVSNTVVSSGNPEPTNIEVPDSCFNARHIFIRVETIDGVEHTVSLNPDFFAFDKRHTTLKEIQSNGFVWVAERERLTNSVRDWDIVLAPDKERARAISKNGVSKIGFRELFSAIANTIKTRGGFGGNILRNRPSDVLTGYCRENYTQPLPTGESDLNTFLEVMPTEAEVAHIIEVPSHNELVFVKDGHTFSMKFSGRATNSNHTPTKLAEEIGVGTIENLENEHVLIGPNPNLHLAPFDSVGANKTGTFALGTK